MTAPAATTLRLMAAGSASASGDLPPRTMALHVPALWRLLGAGEAADKPALSRLAQEWWVECALSRLPAGHNQAPGAVRLALAAVDEWRALGQPTAALARAASGLPAAQDLVQLVDAYERALGDRADAALPFRAALSVARGADWPAPLSRVARVELPLSHEWLGRDLALAQAMAASGRQVVVHANGALLHDAGGPTAPAAAPYQDALLKPFEASPHAGVEVAFEAGDRPGAQATTTVRRVAGGLEASDRLVFDVAAAIAGGTPPEQIAIVLPPSAPPLWRRRLATRRLRERLSRAGIAHQRGPLPRFGDQALGRLCNDALALAQELAASPRAPQLSLAPWGRLLAALAPRPGAAGDWPRPAVDQRLAPEALPAWLARAAGGASGALAAAGQELVACWLRPLAEPSGASLAEILWSLAEAAFPAASAAFRASLEGERAVLRQALGDIDRARTEAPAAPAAGAWLAFVRRALERAPCPLPPSPKGGVALLRPEDLAAASYEAVFVACANEPVWFRPPPANPFVPEALSRALARQGTCVWSPSASVAGERPLSARDRTAWLWHQALGAARHAFTAYLLEGGEAGEDALEPAIEALLAAGAAREAPRLAVAQEPLAAQVDLAARARAEAAHGPPASVRVADARLAADSCRSLEARLLQNECSVSKLDELARCRFRFFAGALLDLAEDDPVQPFVSLRLLGTAMHAALKDAVDAEGERRQANGGQLPLAPAALADSLRLAEAAFYHDAQAYIPEGRVHPSLRGAALSDVWTAVAVQLEAAWSAPVHASRWTEVAFGGRATRAPVVIAEPAGGRRLRVRGQVDRIDQAASGITAYDYKRSDAKRMPHRHLQLPIYALVAARQGSADTPIAAAWLTLTGARAGRARPAADVTGTPAELKAQVARDTWARLAPLLDGNVAPDPAPKESCRHCRFVRLCHLPEELGDGEEETGDHAP